MSRGVHPRPATGPSPGPAVTTVRALVAARGLRGLADGLVSVLLAGFLTALGLFGNLPEEEGATRARRPTVGR